MNATATAMPTAADTYWWSTSASIWLRWLIVDSPAYACQLVLVRKLTAVLKLSAGADRGQVVRVERQVLLQPQQRVGEQEAHQAERQQRHGVAAPPLLALFVDAARPDR